MGFPVKVEDFEKFKTLMITLSELYEKSPSEGALKMYALALQSYTIEQVSAAIGRAVIELKWFPKPAELIELIQGSVVDRAEQAWQIAWEAYKRAGYYESVLFQDGAIARAITIVFGGWIQFSEASRQLSPEMMQAKRKEFLSTYRRESRYQHEPQRLPGHYEIENLNAVQTWTRDQFSDTYRQRIFIAQESGGRFIDANFHRNSAQLIESNAQLLNAASQPQLPAKPMLQLVAPQKTEPVVPMPEDVKKGIALLMQSVKSR
jgi:hypothetical protein